MEGFIGYNGRDDIMIDRFDGRAMLDIYREPDERMRNRPKTEEQLELDEVKEIAPPSNCSPRRPSLSCKLQGKGVTFAYHLQSDRRYPYPAQAMTSKVHCEPPTDTSLR